MQVILLTYVADKSVCYQNVNYNDFLSCIMVYLTLSYLIFSYNTFCKIVFSLHVQFWLLFVEKQLDKGVKYIKINNTDLNYK